MHTPDLSDLKKQLFPFNYADAIICVLAQRLGRTFCKDCKQSYHPSKAHYDELLREYGIEDIRVQAIKDGITNLKQDGIEKIFAGHLDLLQVRKVCIK